MNEGKAVPDAMIENWSTTLSLVKIEAQTVKDEILPTHLEDLAFPSLFDAGNESIDIKEEPLDIPMDTDAEQIANDSFFKSEHNNGCYTLEDRYNYHSYGIRRPELTDSCDTGDGRENSLFGTEQGLVDTVLLRGSLASTTDSLMCILPMVEKTGPPDEVNAGVPFQYDKSFGNKYFLAPHLRSFGLNQPYRCFECGQVFAKKYLWKEHSLLKHPALPYKHKGCEEASDSETKMKSISPSSLKLSSIKSLPEEQPVNYQLSDDPFHNGRLPKDSQSGGDQRIFACEFCTKKCRRKASLAAHIRSHLQPLGQLPECPTCGKTCRNAWSLRSHIRTHTNEKFFACGICGKTCRQNWSLNIHMRSHTQLGLFKCEICGKICSQKWSLAVHMRSHTQEGSFKCSVCEKICRQQWSLDVHMRSHTQEGSFKCSICEKVCRQQWSLDVHMRSHTQVASFKCGICGKICRQQWSLDVHIRSHTQESSFQCSVCGKICRQQWSLDVHMRSHTHQGSFKCGVCGKICRQKWSLDVHMRSHTPKSVSIPKEHVLGASC